MCVGNLLLSMLINWICHTKSQSDFFSIPEFFKMNVQNQFLSKNYLRICYLVLWIHKGCCVFKKAGVKCSYYTNHIKGLGLQKKYNLIVFSVSFHKLYTVKGYIFFPLPLFFRRKRKKRKDFNIFVISDILWPSYFGESWLYPVLYQNCFFLPCFLPS